MAYLDDTGLAYFWGKIKAWANSVFALLGHTHPSSDVTAMTGYSMPQASSAISSGDTLNQAVGKLEKAITAADIFNVVHKTGTETVTGMKIFSQSGSTQAFLLDNETIDLTSSPNESLFYNILFRDKNDVSLAKLEYAQRATGEQGCNDIKLFCRKNTNDSNYTALYLGYDWNGIPYLSGPSTSASRTDGNDVVTRDWIPNDNRIVHTTGNETISGVKTFTNSANFSAQNTINSEHYKVFLRNDDSNFWILLSDYDGSSYNSLRPFRIGLSTGDVAVNNRYVCTQHYEALHIYVSSSGDDNNDGLTSSTPVKTIGAALKITTKFVTYRYTYFHFGPGNWGDLLLQLPTSNNISITNFTDDAITTLAQYDALFGNSAVPSFTSITAYNSELKVHNIKVNRLTGYNSIVSIDGPISFGHFGIVSTLAKIEAPYYVHDSDSTDGIFILIGGYLKHGAVSNTFKSNLTQSTFLQCDIGTFASFSTGASWSGTFSGTKFFGNNLVHFASGGLSLDDLPGTGWSPAFNKGSLISAKSTSPNINLINDSIAKSETPASGTTCYWSLNFADKNAVEYGSQQTNIGLIQCQKLDTAEQRICFQVFKHNTTGADYALAAVGYRANGTKYFRVPSTLGFWSDDYGQIVGNGDNAQYIFISPCNNWNKGASLALYGSAHGSVPGHVRIRACDGSGNYKDLLVTPTSHLYWGGSEYHGPNNNTSFSRYSGGTSYENGSYLLVTGKDFSGYTGRFQLCARNGSGNVSLIGQPSGSLQWNGQNIQTTSDERKKDFISGIPDDVLDAWGAVEWVRFKYRADIAEKGEENCRWHSGLVAQRAAKACADAGVDILSYGMLCHDQSRVDTETDELADLWMARYEEALCMEAAYLRRENARLKERLAALEARLSALELGGGA